MVKIAYFGHNAGDAAIAKRVAGFQSSGFEVVGFMMRRGEAEDRPWFNIDLGRTYDAAYLQRLRSIYNGADIAYQHKSELVACDVICARNLDMLFCAHLVRQKLRLSIPIIYECLDVHHLITQSTPLGFLLRRLEKGLLKKSSLLVYSSPAFEREFFSKYYKGLYTPYLLENKIAHGEENYVRPSNIKPFQSPLKIGWFGVLRCQRTLDLLINIASQFPETVQVTTAGKPAGTQIPDFDDRISRLENFEYLGPYEAKKDLEELYAQVDVVWAGDFYQADYNSKWLLPNRIYEGGYFAVPPIAPSASETGAWIAERKIGFCVNEQLEEMVPALIEELLANPEQLQIAGQRLIDLPHEALVHPADALSGMVHQVLSQQGE